MARRRIWKNRNKPAELRERRRLINKGKRKEKTPVEHPGRGPGSTGQAGKSRLVLTVPEDVPVDVNAMWRELSAESQAMVRALMAQGVSFKGAVDAMTPGGNR